MILNYKYGLHPPSSGWDEVCEREIRLQDVLWNKLVQIEIAYRADVEETIRQEENYRKVADSITALTAQIDALVGERAAARKAAKAKIATPWLDEQINDLSDQRRQKWTVVKPLRSAAFREHRDELKTLADRRYSDITTARQGSGLWWSNYNAVIASFDGTLRRLQPWQMPILKQPGERNGRLTVQIQQGCPAPAFLAGARNEARIINIKNGEASLIATVCTEGRGNRKTATWPMIMHRPLPDGSIVKSLTITRRRPVPTSRWVWKWDVVVTVDVPQAETSTAPACCGVDLGWRKVPDGVRVATIVDNDNNVEHVVLPARMLERRALISELQGQIELNARDKGTDKTEQYHWHRLSMEIAKWNRRRRDLYRVAAANLVKRYHLIGMDGTGIAGMAQDRRLPPETRRMRTWAAPAELAAAIRDAVRRHSASLREIEGASTIVCHHCGHKNAASEADRLNLIWTCGKCGKFWDQDENAARNCLSAALDVTASESVSVKAVKERRKPPRLTRKRDRSKDEQQPDH